MKTIEEILDIIGNVGNNVEYETTVKMGSYGDVTILIKDGELHVDRDDVHRICSLDGSFMRLEHAVQLFELREDSAEILQEFENSIRRVAADFLQEQIS